MEVKLTKNQRLTPTDYHRNTFHMEFDTTGTGLTMPSGYAATNDCASNGNSSGAVHRSASIYIYSLKNKERQVRIDVARPAFPVFDVVSTVNPLDYNSDT